MVVSEVNTYYERHCHTVHDVTITPSMVQDQLKCLNKNSAPGCDGVTVKHLIMGASDQLYRILSNLYSVILSWNIVPDILRQGIIIPVLKKSTLNPNQPENYRPITLSSTHAKLVELLIMPDDLAHKNQFGFRKSRGTSIACSLINDTIKCLNGQNSPAYVCALDAQKCFDRIWHHGLFFKLMTVLDISTWLFLFHWYTNSRAIVRWNSTTSLPFTITRGTRQGSLLSPWMFNLFINDLLVSVYHSNYGVRVGDTRVNSVAYADDITLLSAMASGLQQLIDICVDYSDEWRFLFNAKKSTCTIIGIPNLCETPIWKLRDQPMPIVDRVTILGTVFHASGKSDHHVEARIQACRRNAFSLQGRGMSYPGLSSDVKAHLWRTTCSPVLTYGMECLALNRTSIKRMESLQGSLVKRCLGIPKRNHHSDILCAMNIPTVETTVVQKRSALFHRACKVDSQMRDLNMTLLSRYILRGTTYPGTMINNLVSIGISPLDAAFYKHINSSHLPTCDGIVDSLKHLIMHEHFIKPWSESHVLTVMLTKSF